jgi:hypothetical protein
LAEPRLIDSGELTSASIDGVRYLWRADRRVRDEPITLDGYYAMPMLWQNEPGFARLETFLQERE